jgi:hypothetical protein
MIAGVVSTRAIFVHTPELVAFAAPILAYPDGFTISLHVAARGPEQVRRQAMRKGRLWTQFSSEQPRVDLLDDDPDLTVSFADGRSQTMDDELSQEARAIHVCSLGSEMTNGDELRWGTEAWITPLPPEGPVVFRLRWPSLGIDATATVEGREVLAASSDALSLWSE